MAKLPCSDTLTKLKNKKSKKLGLFAASDVKRGKKLNKFLSHSRDSSWFTAAASEHMKVTF